MPEKVKMHFAPLAGKLLELKRPSGNEWYVGLIENGDNLVLGPGWHDFVSVNSVSQSDLLVFKYTNGTTFEVLIFDRNGSEKSFRTEEDSTGSMQFVTSNESRQKPVNFTARLPDSGLHANEEDGYSENDNMSKTETPPLTSSKNSGEFPPSQFCIIFHHHLLLVECQKFLKLYIIHVAQYFQFIGTLVIHSIKYLTHLLLLFVLPI